MQRLFVDASILIAEAAPRDQHHAAARRILVDLAKSHELIAHHGILMEVVTVLRRAVSAEAAARWGQEIVSSNLVLLPVDTSDWLEAMSIMARFAEHRFSSIDAISFALIRRHKIRKAASFDHHFRIALPDCEIVDRQSG